MEKKLFVVIHTHRFGTSVGFVKAAEMPSEEKACEALDFDWEDEETVEVFEVNPKETVEI